MRRPYLYFFGLITAALLIAGYWYVFEPAADYLLINGHKIYVEVVASPRQRERGLSGHKNLPENQGMLFLFPHADNRFFWMKGMKFSLDIIWIKGNRVVGLKEDAPPAPGPDYPHYPSPVPVEKVLELNAGLSKELGIIPGQSIKFHLVNQQNIF